MTARTARVRIEVELRPDRAAVGEDASRVRAAAAVFESLLFCCESLFFMAPGFEYERETFGSVGSEARSE
jgi:hypothetical protein